MSLTLLRSAAAHELEQPRTRPRYLVAYLPSFRLERCGYEASQQAVLVTEQHRVLRLVACSCGARERGLEVGMSLSQARALCPEVGVEELDATGEAEDRRSLLRILGRFSDHLGAVDEERMMVMVHNTSHLWGGEGGLLREIRCVLTELGHRCRLVIASELATAAALARWGPEELIVSAGEGRDELAKLSLAALEPPPDLLATFQDLGIRLIGELAQLSAAAIGSRFGEAGRMLHRRACAVSDAIPALMWDTLQWPQVGLVFGYEITSTESLKPILPRLLEQLSQQLAARSEAVMALRCQLITERTQPLTLWVRPGRPTRNPNRLLGLLEARLESAQLGAPLVELRLEALEVSPEPNWQLGLTSRTEAREPLPELLARLEHVLGAQRLFRAQRGQRWLPEKSLDKAAFPGEQLVLSSVQTGDVVDQQEAPERWEERARPNLMLRKPYLISMEVNQAGVPTCMLLPNGRMNVLRAIGPERLQGEWWLEEGGFQRDYWTLDLGSRTAWAYRTGFRWYLHGWFD